MPKTVPFVEAGKAFSNFSQSGARRTFTLAQTWRKVCKKFSVCPEPAGLTTTVSSSCRETSTSGVLQIDLVIVTSVSGRGSNWAGAAVLPKAVSFS